MALDSAASLLDALRRFHLLSAAQLKELDGLTSSFVDPKALAKDLLVRGWLTAYQANQLFQGKGQELLLGSYLLLERLGEGGMGQVFKARHRTLDRIVALKMVHKDRVANPDAVKRFQREVRAAAQLSHPNVVIAFDADQVGGTHFLVMEYVEATDLSQLVKKQGPLTVEQAGECIRQAALGLQHAHERGLVHRDIKPSNLLLTAKGSVVKILDMGLARLALVTAADDKSSTMTHEGAVMGTPDYIAPEQALDSHKVDIRGDIYSLGCTLYFLLAGKVPFPGGTLTEKLLKHQLKEPMPVEQLRPDVPAGVAAVLRKMMAKKPEERCQSPVEVADSLASVLGRDGHLPVAIPVDQTIADGQPRSSSAAVTSDTVEVVNLTQRQRREAERRRLLRLTVAGGGLLVGALALFGVLLFWQSPSPMTAGRLTVVERPGETPKTVGGKVDEAWLKRVAGLPAEEQVKEVGKKLRELNPDFDGTVTHKPVNGVVMQLQFLTDNVMDISPVRALTGLKGLSCFGSAAGKGKLFDLSPLKDMKLTNLSCARTKVADLSPLKGMPLTYLNLSNCIQVRDLTPLQGMKLEVLDLYGCNVRDLSPLKDMPLTYLSLQYCRQSWDVTPLKDMKLLKTLALPPGITDKDLTLLKGMPLDRLILAGSDQVMDLTPLHGLPITTLTLSGCIKVHDLTPLKDMKLTYLDIQRCDQVTDLTPLKDMNLTDMILTPKCITKGMDILRQMKSLKTIGINYNEEKFPANEFWKKYDAGDFK